MSGMGGGLPSRRGRQVAGQVSKIILGDQDAPKRLGKLLKDRRVELGYMNIPAFYQARVVAAGRKDQIGERFCRVIEDGSQRGRHKSESLKIAAIVYGVTEESIYDVLERRGEKLETTDRAPGLPAAPPVVPPPAGGMNPAETAEARLFIDRIVGILHQWELRYVARYAQAHPDVNPDTIPVPVPPGGELFVPGSRDARDWDSWKARGIPRDEMVWFLAYIWSAQARGQGHSSGNAS